MSTRGSAEERHVPVLRDRIVELLAPALQRARVGVPRRHPRHGRPHRGRPGGAAPPRAPSASTATPRRWHLAGERLAAYGDRFTGVHAVYDELPRVLADLGLATVDAVLFDLGVSSLQLDEAERGFAYRHDAPLDMRMDQSGGITAAEVLNTYDAPELERILRDYGEERFARRIAAAIVREREREPFTTSARLVELLQEGHPGRLPEERRPPGQAHLPGAADRGQRRARGLGERPAGRGRRARRRRPDRRPELPLAGGPADQAAVRPGGPRHHPAGPAGRAARARAVPAAAHPRGRGAQRRREGHQPPRSVGPAAGRRTHQSHEGTAPMSQMTAPSRIPQDHGTPSRARPRPAGRAGHARRPGRLGQRRLRGRVHRAAGGRPDEPAADQHLDEPRVVHPARPAGHLR